MTHRLRVLLQCSIGETADDWHVGRFSLLREEMAKVAEVVARNREPTGTGDDPVLSSLNREAFDELWLLGVDGGEGLSPADVAGVNAFQRQGGGILTARDHANMGLWLRGIEGVGAAHFFHKEEFCEPEVDRHCPDDRETPTISWPNYHSGQNGDLQRIVATDPGHPLLRNERSPRGRIEAIPAHPHEGAVREPKGQPRARTVARGTSQTTGRGFDLIVAFERDGEHPGRAIAESSFHHFADYNWDLARGAPSFVTERPGSQISSVPGALDDVRAYVRNAVAWLAPAEAARP
jgi:hypothetical protein